MKTEKIKLFILCVVIGLTIAGVFYGVIESILDKIYLKQDFAFAISDKISLTTVGKGGTNKQYTFGLMENGMQEAQLCHFAQMEPNTLSSSILPIQIEIRRQE